MIIVHHLQQSRSVAILFFLEELGLDYEVKTYARDSKSNLAPAAYKKIHPLGKSPIVEIDGETYVETAAIMELILETRAPGKLQPAPGHADRYRYLHWMHAVEGSLMPLLVMGLILGRMEERAPFFAKPIAKALVKAVREGYLGPSLAGQMSWLDTECGRSEWIAGDEFSAADIQLAFPLAAAAARGALSPAHGNIKAYVERLTARPAYQAAMAKAGEMKPVS
jgi:glutathione S-transferase